MQKPFGSALSHCPPKFDHRRSSLAVLVEFSDFCFGFPSPYPLLGVVLPLGRLLCEELQGNVYQFSLLL